ncbi:MAG: hypothetical protein ACR2P4_05300 [Gammaproteobacteria bacterium]
MLLSTLDMSFFRIARRTAHGARRTAHGARRTAHGARLRPLDKPLLTFLSPFALLPSLL